MQDLKGLKRVETMLRTDRLARMKELKKEGRTVMGYMCCFVPLEMLTALDIAPFRLIGDCEEVTTEADKYLETIMCSFLRSAFDLAMKKTFDFADGVIFTHSCDSVVKTWEYWRYFAPNQFEWYINVPHIVKASSERFFTKELLRLQKALEAYTHKEMTNESLRKAIRLHNRNRQLMRNLNEFRKENPPRVSGAEMRKTLLACMSLPVEEANSLLEEVIAEVKARVPLAPPDRHRILLYGPEMDNDFVDLVEECGASVVIDDVCIGTRYYAKDVDWGIEPLDALNRRYLEQMVCPRVYRRPDENKLAPGETYERQDDLDLRLSYLRDYAEDWKADGAIMYLLRYCDSHEFDAPDVRDYLQEAKVPVLFLEGDYMVTKEQNKTRIQAFLEMLDA
ncbi:MAG: 2-hydroxyacyl-CoA dehydratase family protein [Gracilibacteraceae bacterium]|nr:2-hydroxyacyl-CoA dehydratase family protein [Gracilibacteraceae bacterium]